MLCLYLIPKQTPDRSFLLRESQRLSVMTIGKTIFCLAFSLLSSVLSQAAQPDYITYENKRMGTLEEPYLLRTYVPSLELDEEVLAHHSRGFPSPPLFTFQRSFVHERILRNDSRHSGRHQRKLRTSSGLCMGQHRMQVTLCLGKWIPRFGKPLGLSPKRSAQRQLLSPSFRAGLLQDTGETTSSNQWKATFRPSKLPREQAYSGTSRILLFDRWKDDHRYSQTRPSRSDSRGAIRFLEPIGCLALPRSKDFFRSH